MANLEAIEREMRSLGWWYQHLELPNGLQTGNGQEPGYNAKARWNFIAQRIAWMQNALVRALHRPAPVGYVRFYACAVRSNRVPTLWRVDAQAFPSRRKQGQCGRDWTPASAGVTEASDFWQENPKVNRRTSWVPVAGSSERQSSRRPPRESPR